MSSPSSSSLSLSPSLSWTLVWLKLFLGIQSFLVLSQTWAAFVDYDYIASLKLQEPRILADEAVVQSNRSIGAAQGIVMLPLLLLAWSGIGIYPKQHQQQPPRWYGIVSTWILCGTSLYWPVMFVASRFVYASANIPCVPLNGADFMICTLMFLWALFICIRLYHHTPELIQIWWISAVENDSDIDGATTTTTTTTKTTAKTTKTAKGVKIS